MVLIPAQIKAFCARHKAPLVRLKPLGAWSVAAMRTFYYGPLVPFTTAKCGRWY